MVVMSLKRLVVGSISLSEDSQQAEKPGQEMDACQSTGDLLCEAKGKRG